MRVRRIALIALAGSLMCTLALTPSQAPTTAQAQTAPTATRTPAPARTAAARTPAPGRTAVARTPAPAVTPTPLPGYYDRLPRDKKGRIIGRGSIPIINYTPTMITGKRCPRVKQWDVRRIDLPDPLNDIYVADNPCVVQNMLDDVLPMLYYQPSGWDPDTMRNKIIPEARKDPDFFRLTSSYLQDDVLNFWEQKSYMQCDKPIFMLLDVGPDQPSLMNLNTNDYHADRFGFRMLFAAADAQPFTCRFYNYGTGKFKVEWGAKESDMEGRSQSILSDIITAVYDRRIQRWIFFGTTQDTIDALGGREVTDYRKTVLRLLNESPVKP